MESDKTKPMRSNFPVVLFCYDRPMHLEYTIASLKENRGAEETPLFIFSDGAKGSHDKEAVEAVRNIIDRISGFKEIHITKNPANSGLAMSIINGVSEVLKKFSGCIVLEDDLETSPFFLDFMNQGLLVYEKDADIFSVSGYCPPINIPEDYPFDAFRFPRINSWGWATWADRWAEVDWDVQNFNDFIQDPESVKRLERQGKDLPVMLLKQQTGKIGSWAVRFNQACFNAGKTNIYPVKSLIRNIGIDGTGTHMKASGKYGVELFQERLSAVPSVSDERIDKAFSNFYRPSRYRRYINKIKIARYISNMH